MLVGVGNWAAFGGNFALVNRQYCRIIIDKQELVWRNAVITGCFEEITENNGLQNSKLCCIVMRAKKFSKIANEIKGLVGDTLGI